MSIHCSCLDLGEHICINWGDGNWGNVDITLHIILLIKYLYDICGVEQ